MVPRARITIRRPYPRGRLLLLPVDELSRAELRRVATDPNRSRTARDLANRELSVR